jgi:small-conductance mechanosensitive channel
VAIWHGFREAGITIPYPQRDVHLRQVPGPDATNPA